MFNRFRRTEHVGHAHIDDVKAFAEEGDVRGWFVAEEFAMPDPRFAGRGMSRHHDENRFSIDGEIVAVIAVPSGFLPGERRGDGTQLRIQRLGFHLGFVERQTLAHAGPQMLHSREPGIAEYMLFLGDEFEHGGRFGMRVEHVSDIGHAAKRSGGAPVD